MDDKKNTKVYAFFMFHRGAKQESNETALKLRVARDEIYVGWVK